MRAIFTCFMGIGARGAKRGKKKGQCNAMVQLIPLFWGHRCLHVNLTPFITMYHTLLLYFSPPDARWSVPRCIGEDDSSARGLGIHNDSRLQSIKGQCRAIWGFWLTFTSPFSSHCHHASSSLLQALQATEEERINFLRKALLEYAQHSHSLVAQEESVGVLCICIAAALTLIDVHPIVPGGSLSCLSVSASNGIQAQRRKRYWGYCCNRCR